LAQFEKNGDLNILATKICICKEYNLEIFRIAEMTHKITQVSKSAETLSINREHISSTVITEYGFKADAVSGIQRLMG